MSKVDPIPDWKYIFLDTSVIIDLLQNPERLKHKNEKHYNRVADTKKVLIANWSICSLLSSAIAVELVGETLKISSLFLQLKLETL
ncbi:MAG TPA: hypothetical protein VK021_08125 [Flavobacteriaceae bacterium]|nr:hypothetical protein [Flavobacteriaceae bacterium]